MTDDQLIGRLQQLRKEQVFETASRRAKFRAYLDEGPLGPRLMIELETGKPRPLLLPRLLRLYGEWRDGKRERQEFRNLGQDKSVAAVMSYLDRVFRWAEEQ